MNTLKDWTCQGADTRSAQEAWAQSWAGLGAVAWAGLAVLAHLGIAPIGSIELIFLFAPLLIVPLGMQLARVIESAGRIDAAARTLQPAGAALAILALCLPPGRLAGALASGWMLVCGLTGLSGVVDLFPGLSKAAGTVEIPTSADTGQALRQRSGQEWGTHVRDGVRLSIFRFALGIAKIDLVVGGMWFVASRLGMRPMGIQEPIGLLTAVHFHFAGFATALIAAAALRFAETRGGGRWLKWLVAYVVGMPFVVAAGFAISPEMRMIAAVGFSAGVAVLAVFLRSCGRHARNATSRIFLQVAAVSVFAGMVLAVVYAIAVLRGSDLLPIPQMARTHGVLNAVGFCMCGLLGWLVEWSEDRGLDG